jgi:hypothetical protein
MHCLTLWRTLTVRALEQQSTRCIRKIHLWERVGARVTLVLNLWTFYVVWAAFG